MVQDFTLRGLLLGIIAGLLAALFDGLFMLIPNVYVPYSYPFLLITFNTFFWMIVGSLSGFLVWVFVGRRAPSQGNRNFYWVAFFILPFTIIYGLLGRFYIPLKVWTFIWGSPVFDHNLSFLWVALMLIFLFVSFNKPVNEKVFPPIFFVLEIVTFMVLFHFCSNLLYIKVPGIYTKLQIYFQYIALEREQFLVLAYIVGVLSIVGFYFFAFFKIRPYLYKKHVGGNYRQIIVLFFLVVCCLTGFFAWSHYSYNKRNALPIFVDKNKEAAEVSHIILIVLDTVRADHLSIYGYTGTTKNMEEFAKDALVFENCIATSSWTIPSHASIFTGFYTTEHGCHGILDTKMETAFGFALPAPLSEQFITLAENLKDKNYITAGCVSNPILFNPELKLDQGFQIFNKPETLTKMFQKFPFRPGIFLFCYLTNICPEYTIHYRRADVITMQSTDLIEKLYPYNFFLFMNYMDAHIPYGPPRPFAGYFLDVAFPQIHRLKQHYLFIKNKLNKKSWFSYQRSQYDGEIAYLDDQLGRFFSRLKEVGLYDSSLIIITSDHGELFGEHGLKEHRTHMYEGVIKVPLLIKFPYSRRVGREKKMITLTDLYPTILSICKLPISKGISGKAFGDASSPAVSELYEYETGEHRAIYDGKYKYMAYENKRGPELYDLDSDPMEMENLIEELPEVVLAMEKKLKDWERAHGPKYASSAKQEATVISEKTLKELRALGYIR